MTSPVPSDPGQVSLPKEKPRLHRQCGFTAKGDEACKDARGATLFRLVHDGQQKIPRMKRKGCLHQSHSSRPVGLARKRTCLSRSALVTVASPGPASGGHSVLLASLSAPKSTSTHCSPSDSPVHSHSALLSRSHLSGTLWNPLRALLFRFTVFSVQLLRLTIPQQIQAVNFR